ncbi:MULTISPECIES: HAD family hydrolase [Haloferax]|uniref:HAD-IA family hydrolase n=2 Tax=Haloferax TaxID=2251 RepID=A0A6G1Z1Q9_9EURY|nr:MULTISPECIES: HAD family hydrolase [Haloferax]KAB1187707.1 HAD family hydrolase [Haloferax sp. CBA1149]MRW80368.1 HAD-IA family hydrolase [Haloferax marinisediminis]
MSVSAVGFDLDYTLAVPTRDRETILSEAAAAAGAPPLSREAYLRAHQENLTRETRAPIFEALLAEHDSPVDPEHVATAYRERITDAVVPVSGVEAMLTGLRTTYRVGLLTNGPVVAQEDKIEKLGWFNHFDTALVTGALPAGKPDVRSFEALLDGLDTPPEETVYVGDSVHHDIAGAHDAGMLPVQVVGDDCDDPDPRAIAHIPRELLPTKLPELLADL